MAIIRSHSLSVGSPRSRLRYSVKGSKGTFTKSGIDVQEDQLKAHPASVSSSDFGTEPEDIYGALEILQEDGTVTKTTIPSEKGSHISLYRNLAAVIREGSSLDVKWEEASVVIQLVELAKQSALEGKTLDVPL